MEHGTMIYIHGGLTKGSFDQDQGGMMGNFLGDSKPGSATFRTDSSTMTHGIPACNTLLKSSPAFRFQVSMGSVQLAQLKSHDPSH